MEPNPDRLSLALEPECASLYCHHVREFKEDSYLLVDIGGGTVDIVSHRIIEGHFEEIDLPKGNAWGGVTVNATFQKFLGQALEDPNFSSYIGSDVEDNEIRAGNEKDLDSFINKEFEEIKQDFTDYNEDECPESFTITLPMSLWDKYKERIKATQKAGISFNLEQHELTIYKKKMAELFEPTIREIVGIVKEVLEDGEGVIKDVFLAGWFGGCHYVKLKLQSALEEMQQNIQVHPAPQESELGIVHGALLFRCNPSTIHKRKADATYGVYTVLPFKSGVHDESKKTWDEDQKEYYCEDLFCTIVERGDTICSGSVFVSSFSTTTANHQRITFEVYVSPNTNVWYVTEPCVQMLGKFILDLSGVGINRKMEVAIDFTHTEIQVHVYETQNPEYETKTVVDFLDPKQL